MGKITIQEISAKLVAQNDLSKKEATRFVNKMFDLIRDALERDMTVKVKGLGTFKIIDVDSRESVNVNTGERVLIEGHNKITFTPDVLMKELVNKPFSQFETIVLNEGVDFKDSDNEDVEAQTEDDGEMGDMPLVDFIAPDPIDLGTPVEPEKPIAPVVSETPIVPDTPDNSDVPESSGVPEISDVPETPVFPKPQEIQETPTEPETDTPELPEEASDESSADESSVEDEDVEEEEEADTVAGGMKWPMVLLACLISLLVGYLLGNYLPWNRQTEPIDVPALKTEKVKKVPVQKADAKPVAIPANQPKEKVEAPAEKATPSEEKTDMPVAAPVEQPKSEAPKPAEAQKPAEVPKPQPVATAPAEVKLDKYEAMDARVRTGAYRIVGLDHKDKVKEGENLQRLTKRTLGSGMECYIEVFNGLTATSQLKAGQEIKIPKVELKKKKQSKISR